MITYFDSDKNTYQSKQTDGQIQQSNVRPNRHFSKRDEV